MAEFPDSHTDDGAGQPPPATGWFNRFLRFVEWLGNLLPHPVTLFAIFALSIVLSAGWPSSCP